jgi:small subunit ribosomal protein S5
MQREPQESHFNSLFILYVMSDTPVTQEIETPETATPVMEEVSTSTEAPLSAKRGDRNDRPNGDRRPPRKDRNWIREEEKEFKEEMIAIDRVTRVTAGGRQLRFRASIIIGDGKGRVGLGLGKSGEVQGAIEKAIRDAKKNLITFPIVNGTIPHDVAVNFKSSSIFLHPAHPGTGIIAGWSVRKIFAVSGIKDIIAKQHGAPNGITNARVTMKALQALKPLSQIKTFGKAATVAAQTETVEKVAPVAKKPAPAKKAPAKKSAE